MRVFVFDLTPYKEHLDHLKVGAELPWPLPRRHFEPRVAVDTYAEHLAAWEALDRLGYDGVGFNEHHTSPYGLMNSPNLMAASAAQRTQRIKLLIYGNLLPLHEPLRLAEELAMLDCLSNGRIVSGFARGIPREYNVYRVPLSESRDRFEEAWEIIRRAWTEEVFSFSGKYWSYEDVAIWPRPVQQPHPPVWVPVSGSQETIEWAGRHDVPITPGLVPTRGLREDIIRYYARCLAEHGHRITPDHLIIQASAYVADSKARAVAEAGPYTLYFNRTLFSHGNVQRGQPAAGGRVPVRRLVRLRAAREHGRGLRLARPIPRHDPRERRAGRRGDALGHAERGHRAHHRGRRSRRRGNRAHQHEPRRDAPRDVHGADQALRDRGAARAPVPSRRLRAARLTGPPRMARTQGPPLEQRRLGRTDMLASVLGFGGSEIGYQQVSARTVERLLGGALDAGLNVIDTAECYDESESLIGRAVGSRRREFHLFTKCGHGQGWGRADWRPSAILASIERSLKRLATDHVDLVQLHSCSLEHLKKGDAIAALEQARERGFTRYVGYSGDGEAARYAVECGRFDVLQTSVSVADQEAIELTLPLAAARGVGVIAKRPLANAVWRYARKPAEPYYQPYWTRLRELGPELLGQGDDAGATALRFTLAVPGVHTAIVGTTRPERWLANAALLRAGALPASDYARIRARWAEVARPSWVGQT